MNASLTCQLPATNLAIPIALKKKEVLRTRPPPNFLKVLIVDDNKHRGVTNAAVITGLGHSVDLACSGIAALRMAATNRPDAVLLSTNIGCSDDCDVARHLRSDYPVSPPLIIGFASHTTSLTRWRSVMAEMDLVLEAPLDTTAIETLLLLDRAKLKAGRDRARFRASYPLTVAAPRFLHVFDTTNSRSIKEHKQESRIFN